jgi:ATP-dependent helicase/nuclease subunit A
VTGLLDSLNDEQHAAVIGSEPAVAVAAGAGCGKTRVLTTRLLRELEATSQDPDAAGLGQIVALTFTEKAARELRGRVREFCRLAATQAESPAERAAWKAHLRGLEAAAIGTFHSYCGRLLRQFPVESGVEPGFGVLDDELAPAVLDHSIDATLRDWLAAGRDDVIALAVDLGPHELRQSLARLVRDRIRGDLNRLARLDPDQIVTLWRERFESDVCPALLATVEAQSALLVERLNVTRSSHPPMQARIDFVRADLPALTSSPNFAAAWAPLREGFHFKGNRNTHWPSPEQYQSVKAAWDDLKDLIDDHVLPALTWDDSATRAAAEQSCGLARLADEAALAYDREKRRRGLLDFDDLQILARRLLDRRDPAVIAHLERTARLLLVDEFQDTDPVQDAILDQLVAPVLDSRRIFLVGDVKQSIYGFRGAQPSLFEIRRAALPEPARHALRSNYRSIPGLIAFTNRLFQPAFPDPIHRLIACAPAPAAAPSPNAPAAVEFLWAHEPAPAADPDSATPGPSRRRPRVGETRRLEGEWIARLIASRLTGPNPWMVRDPESPTHLRPARAGDVVILLRTLNDSSHYESALARAGIDYHVQGAAAFFGQQEVLDLINLLRTIEDPADPLALAATLRSPFGAVSDAALFWLATSPFGDLCQGFDHWSEIPELDTHDRLAVARIARLLHRWRAHKDRMPIARLLDLALDESGYEAALLAEFLGERRRANVRKLVERARRYDALGGLALADFSARLTAQFRDPPREDEAATTEEQGDAVRLMSIHQSKGLEFPIVILPDLDRHTDPRHARVVLDPDLGVLPLSGELAEFESDSDSPQSDEPASIDARRSLGAIVLRARQQQSDREEALRVFYVATTRARDHLVLSAGRDPASTSFQSEAMKLLAQSCNLTTGAWLTPPEPGSSLPTIHVIDTIPPPTPGATPAQPLAPRESDILATARLIEEAPAASNSTSPPPSSTSLPPAPIDLGPATWLDPATSRLRALLLDCLTDPHPSPERVPHWAALQFPAATRSLQARAQLLLHAWLASSPPANSSPRSAPPWQLSVGPFRFLGAADLCWQPADEPLSLAVIDLASEPTSLSALRLELAQRDAESRGQSVAHAWLLTCDDVGPTPRITWRPAPRLSDSILLDRLIPAPVQPDC